MNKVSVPGTIVAICFIYTIFVSLWIDSQQKQQPETVNACNCISYKEYALRQAKYEMFIDSLINAKKSNRARLQDSVTKHLKQLDF